MKPVHQGADYPYLGDCSVDVRHLPISGLITPFTPKVSASRMEMHASHLTQIMPVKGAEFPHIFSGFEQQLTKTMIDPSKRPNDVDVIDCIPRYGYGTIGNNLTSPSTTVIYRDIVTGEIGCCFINSYWMGSDKVGFLNTVHNAAMIMPGYRLKKDVALTSPPFIDGPVYKQGVRANVLYMSHLLTGEDAFGVSEEFARKNSWTEIGRISFNADPNQLPLNIYGDDETYQFFPDLNQYVREDGIVAAFREINAVNVLYDGTSSAMKEIRLPYDNCIWAPPGARIIDIDVVCGLPRERMTWQYNQIDRYLRANSIYFKRIISIFKKYQNAKLTPDFNILVTEAMSMMRVIGEHNSGDAVPIDRADRPIKFIHLTFTYAIERKFNYGDKVTTNFGGKGVVGAIIKDEDMPVDEFGIKADVIIDPNTNINRMNPAQLYSPAIGRASEFVRRKIAHMTDPTAQWNMYIEYLNDIRPNYATLIEQTFTTPDKRSKAIADIIKDGIYLNIPPFSSPTIGVDFITKLWNKWGVTLSRVTYSVEDPFTKVKRKVTTRAPMCIGEDHINMLSKLPEHNALSSGVAPITDKGMPSQLKSGARKSGQPIRTSPNCVRLGEDETRSILSVTEPSVYTRLHSLQCGSPRGTEATIEALLTAQQPSAVRRVNISNEELSSTNAVLKLLTHMLATVGVTVRPAHTGETDQLAALILDDEPDYTAFDPSELEDE